MSNGNAMGTNSFRARSRSKRLYAAVAIAAIAAVALLSAGLSAADEGAGSALRMAPPGAVSFADVVERVSPAVVNIAVTKSAVSISTGVRPDGFPRGGPELDEFFRRFFGAPDGPRFPRRMQGAGSGFIIDPEGYIATNQHVIDGAEEIVVTLQSGEQLDAVVIGQDERTDLALIKVDVPRELAALEFGDSDSARVGEWVLAIGNPFGLGGTATAGIISARGRDIQSGPYDDYLQIDAPINSGNSGGPVFNGEGEVIGVNTAIYSPNGGSIGIGFAIPANQAKSVIDELKADGSIERGWLGVAISTVDRELAESLGLSEEHGVLIANVEQGGPADRAGLLEGDIVTQFDEAPVDSARTLSRLVGARDANERVSLRVWRDGDALELSVELGELATT